MPGINVNTVSAALTVDGTLAGVIEVADTTIFQLGAICWITNGTTTTQVTIVAVPSATKLTLRRYSIVPNYGYSDMSAFTVGLSSTITQPAQTVFGDVTQVIAATDTITNLTVTSTEINLGSYRLGSFAPALAGGDLGMSGILYNVGGISIGSGTNITKSVRATSTLPTALINANTTAEKTIACAGAIVGAECVVSMAATVEAGLVWSAYVASAGNVTLRLANVTVAGVTPAAAQNYSIRVFNP